MEDLVAWKPIFEEIGIHSSNKLREDVTKFFLTHGPYFFIEMGALYEFVKIMSKILNTSTEKIVATLWGLQREYGLKQTKSWKWNPISYRFRKYREWMQTKITSKILNYK